MPPDHPLPLPADLVSFGFDDPFESWLERLREIEQPAALGTIGSFEVLEEVARGGQGIVYRARTAQGQTIALKRLLAGSFASPHSRERFEREIQAVAGLDHPGIVKLVGMQATADQQLLAMEWVDGMWATAWAAQKPKPVTRELTLVMIAVCDAVQHAHQRGIIHRDLKPSNILITSEGKPKLLDFGLAKLLDSAAETRLTLSDQFAGTLGYAAPEQLRREPADVRSDVYALGVIFYEMLTGTPPHRARTLLDLVQRVDQQEPVRPSLIDTSLARDLDTIVLKALRQHPDDRYQSARELQEDLERCLAGRALRALPPSTWYLTRKLIMRHRLAAVTIALAACTLIGWAVIAGVLTTRLAERTRAAEAARATSDAIATFLNGMLTAAQPTAIGADARLIDVLTVTAERLERELSDQPLVRAAIHATLGQTYASVLQRDQAIRHLQRADALYCEQHESRSQARAEVLRSLAPLLAQRDGEAAIPLAREALALCRSHHDDQDPIVAEYLSMVGFVIWQARGPAAGPEAEALMRDAMERHRRTLPAGHLRHGLHHYHLAAMLADTGRSQDASREYEIAVGMLRGSGSREQEAILAWCLLEYSNTLRRLGDLTRARSALAESEPIHARLYRGELASFTLFSLANIELDEGHADLAIGRAHAALAAAWQARAASHPEEAQAAREMVAFWSGEPLSSPPSDYRERFHRTAAIRESRLVDRGRLALAMSRIVRKAGFIAHADALSDGCEAR